MRPGRWEMKVIKWQGLWEGKWGGDDGWEQFFCAQRLTELKTVKCYLCKAGCVCLCVCACISVYSHVTMWVCLHVCMTACISVGHWVCFSVFFFKKPYHLNQWEHCSWLRNPLSSHSLFSKFLTINIRIESGGKIIWNSFEDHGER